MSNLMKTELKRILLTAKVAIICITMNAQALLRIHHTSGSHTDVPIEHIDSITFINGADVQAEVELTGSWLWGGKSAGYYELLTFYNDNTYTGYDNYFTYGFDTMTYGWYSMYGGLLVLRSYGLGYNRHLTWYLMGLTRNALDVMTRMGRFTYYRLQPESIHLHIGEYMECVEGESFVFADGIITTIQDNRLYGVTKGATYIQKKLATTNNIVSYRVIVE